MVVYRNLHAINLHRIIKFKNWDVQKSSEKIASGQRINRAGDDASGLAVSEKMNSQIKGLRQAERNTEDGISLIQTAEGYLDETQNILQRIRVLAIQSSNGTFTNQDRTMIQVEFSNLVDEIDRVASQASFNNMNLLQGDLSRLNPKASMWLHVGANMHQKERLYITTMTSKSFNFVDKSGAFKAHLKTQSAANMLIGLVDDAITKISKQRSDLGAYQNRMEHTAKNLLTTHESIQSSTSLLRDADMAESMVELTKDNIINDSGNAMLAYSQVEPKKVVNLLYGLK